MNILVILSLRLSTLAVRFLFTLFVARFLGVEDLGVYGLLLALTLFVPVVAGFGLSQNIARNAVITNDADLVSDLIAYGIIIFFFYLVAFSVWLVATSVSNLHVEAWGAITVLIIFEHLNNDGYQLLIGKSAPAAANVLHFIRSAAWCIAFVPFAFFIPELRSSYALVLFWLAGSFVSLIVLCARLWHLPWRTSIKQGGFAWSSLWVQLKGGYRLWFSEVFSTLAMQSDRYLLSLFAGLEQVGIYVFYQQIISAISNLQFTAIIQPYRPQLIKAAGLGGETLRAVFTKMLKIGLFSSICSAVLLLSILPFVLPYLSNHVIQNYYHIMWFMAASFVLTIVYQCQRQFYYAKKMDHFMLRLGFFYALAQVSLNALGAYLWGLIGITISIVLVTATLVLIQEIDIRQRLRGSVR